MTEQFPSHLEDEANAFAMELLMPEHLLRKDIKGGDITDDRWIKKLADKYRVPTATMAIRIGQLIA